jgi:hypothetical protein
VHGAAEEERRLACRGGLCIGPHIQWAVYYRESNRLGLIISQGFFFWKRFCCLIETTLDWSHGHHRLQIYQYELENRRPHNDSLIHGQSEVDKDEACMLVVAS